MTESTRAVKISVAMTTYDGARFLREQLDSIFAQTRVPDEIIVCDDHSSDTTPQLLQEYVVRSPCVMTVIINNENLGSTRNFEKAIGLCTGNIIVLCDQDDVWRPRKLEVIEETFTASPDLGAVLTNADLIDEDGVLFLRDLWTRCRFNARRRRALNSSRRFDLLLGLPFATGATMAFRASFKPLVLPIPTGSPTFLHDRWIAVLIAAVGGIGIIPEKLIAYRIHRQQEMGLGKVPLLLKVFIPHKCQSDGAALAAFDERLRHSAPGSTNPHFWRSLNDRRRHIDARGKFSRNPVRRLKQVAREFRSGRYALYPYGLAIVLQDLLVGTR